MFVYWSTIWWNCVLEWDRSNRLLSMINCKISLKSFQLIIKKFKSQYKTHSVHALATKQIRIQIRRSANLKGFPQRISDPYKFKPDPIQSLNQNKIFILKWSSLYKLKKNTSRVKGMTPKSPWKSSSCHLIVNVLSVWAHVQFCMEGKCRVGHDTHSHYGCFNLQGSKRGFQSGVHVLCRCAFDPADCGVNASLDSEGGSFELWRVGLFGEFVSNVFSKWGW